ncbi:MAG: hypothetical protein H7A23_01960 [Leptospiraceae bacterium]|nr:hypothetical protein [Leptospiraceae bacterium]MCP5493296.1 hypothetical protein [Leptospiraceae bacterium]
MLILLYYSIHTRKIGITIREKETVYSMYIPCEYFLYGDFRISELEKGMYSVKTDKLADEMLYRFSLKPARNVKQPYKQTIQYFVSIMYFPIVIEKQDEIVIYDLSHSYNNNILKVTYNSKIDKILIEGPLF